jgi:AmmeMemoRadiSam system protein B
MAHVRPPAAAGRFYPADPAQLRAVVQGYLEQAASPGPVPQALIAPHAGYPYSGPVAAAAYARLRPARGRIRRAVLIGPAHFLPLPGLALPASQAFATPLGEVPVDLAAMARLLCLPQVRRSEEAHAPEHSLEVHLPFLQEVLGDFALVPLLVGQAPPAQVRQVLEQAWGGEETLVVVSSDLSHFCEYERARQLDLATARAIEQLADQALGPEQACGFAAIRGLLQLARSRSLTAVALDLRNSGDTAGPRHQVVGYGAWAFYSASSA